MVNGIPLNHKRLVRTGLIDIQRPAVMMVTHNYIIRCLLLISHYEPVKHSRLFAIRVVPVLQVGIAVQGVACVRVKKAKR